MLRFLVLALLGGSAAPAAAQTAGAAALNPDPVQAFGIGGSPGSDGSTSVTAEAARPRTSTAAALTCALDLLGRSARTFPPIRILDDPPPEASPQANAFVDRREGAIVLVASAPVFQLARASWTRFRKCPPLNITRLIASIVVHEAWHLEHGPDEKRAYLAQLTALQRLGARPGHWPYTSVVRALQAVDRAQQSRPAPADAALAKAR